MGEIVAHAAHSKNKSDGTFVEEYVRGRKCFVEVIPAHIRPKSASTKKCWYDLDVLPELPDPPLGEGAKELATYVADLMTAKERQEVAEKALEVVQPLPKKCEDSAEELASRLAEAVGKALREALTR